MSMYLPQGVMDRNISASRFFLDLLYAVVISVVIAVLLTLIGIGGSFLKVLIISECFGLSICSLSDGLLWLVKPKSIAAVVLVIIAAVAGGTLIGLHLSPFILRHLFSVDFKRTPKDLLQTIVLALAFGGVISYFFFTSARLKAGRAWIRQERLQRLSKEKEALEANLKLLQAQIEPHFLFNTLSNILSLIDTSPAQGKAMLMDLIHYLRVSLSRTRHELITLNQEIEIIRAYLNILKIRMGERLHFRIEIPDALKSHPFPPMLLQPLVENAVKHGLEPQIQGGKILVRITETNKMIRAEIIDTGIGFGPDTDAGVGLLNVRERLRLLYGEKAQLVIEENEPRGIRAVILVPKAQGDPDGL